MLSSLMATLPADASERMTKTSRIAVLLSAYLLMLVVAIGMAVFELLGLLPLLLMIGAVGGLLHLGYFAFFDSLPDHLDELRSGESRRRGED
jgi:hypothetical protein